MQTELPEADPPKRKRRRFQFSLRSLLIVVTLFCVVGGRLGREATIARERESMRKWVQQNGGWCGVWLGHDEGEPPFLRRLFGDRRVGYVHVPQNATDDDIQRIEAIFPNANLLR
jgi:hypothetical protein